MPGDVRGPGRRGRSRAAGGTPGARRPLLVTLTPNPSIDLLFSAPRLVWDDANRLPQPRRRAGGQGVNAIRALRTLGGDGVAIALLHGAAGDELEALLVGEGTPLVRVEGEGETRVFVAVRELETGQSLLLNPRGPASGPRTEAALLRALERALDRDRPRWLACCGSVPPGIATDLYARAAAMARAAGTRFVADCDGELLRAAVAAGCDLLVPNQQEAERLVGGTIAGLEDAAAAAVELRARGADVACITLGAEGAVLASGDGCWHAAAPAALEGSAVGAGDAFLAALLLALDRGEAAGEALRQAVAAGAAVLKSEGGDLLAVEEYRRQFDCVRLRPLGAGGRP